MTNLRKAAEIALDALMEINKLSIGENAVFLPAEIDIAMDALRQSLAQPEWVGLEEESLNMVTDEFYAGAVWAEAKLKEKNA